jgi:hypothetical protein
VVPDFPQRLRELTADWLTEVLRACGAVRSARVESVAFEPLGRFTTELWRVRLNYEREEEGAPRSVVLKRPAPDRGSRAGEDFENEIRFYRDLAPRSPVRTPRFYFGALDEVAGRALLLLEDVPELATFRWRRGASVAHARLALEALARLHAHWWERVGELEWIPHLGDAQLRASFDGAYERGWRSRRELFRAAAGESFVEIADALIGRVAETLAPLAVPATLLHGDPHGENLPLVEEEGGRHGVLFLDWQGPRRGHAAFDVAVFVVMSFPVEVRRRAEEALVSAHADAVLAAGIRDWPDPWRDYRRGVLRRAARIVEIAETWPLEDPLGQAAFRMVVERCATAAVDLRVGELIV